MTKRISIISPCYNEELNVRQCQAAIVELFKKELPGYEREHIFADNASTDRTVEILREIAATDPGVKVIVNARNVGPLRSTFNALNAATGDAILVMMAVDMQDPPELIATFVRHWEEGHMVVQGVRVDRDEGAVMHAVRRLYYRMVRAFADIDIPADVGEFQLIDRRVLDAITNIDDYNPYIRGLIASTGFAPSPVHYKWRARARGFSKNRLFTLIDIGLNGLLSFTRAPIRLLSVFGLAIAVLSILYAIVNLIWVLVLPAGSVAPGISTMIVAIFFFAGIQLLFLGILGEYILSIHHQVRFGGRVVERERINFDEPPEPKSKRSRSGQR